MATQEYLDEAKTPSVAAIATMAGAIQAFRPQLGEVRRQVAKWIDELSGARLEEADEGLLDLLRESYDFLSIMNNAVTDAGASLGQIAEFGRLWKTKDAEIRAYITAEGLGYTI